MLNLTVLEGDIPSDFCNFTFLIIIKPEMIKYEILCLLQFAALQGEHSLMKFYY